MRESDRRNDGEAQDARERHAGMTATDALVITDRQILAQPRELMMESGVRKMLQLGIDAENLDLAVAFVT
jgi:hypothetical protein